MIVGLDTGKNIGEAIMIVWREGFGECTTLSHSKYDSIKRVFVVLEKDRAFKKDFQRWMIEWNMLDRMVEILGSDHMVMMSKPHNFYLHLQVIGT